MSGAVYSESFVANFRELFDGRRDCVGEESGNRLQVLVDDGLMREHLEGRRRVGVYCIGGQGFERARWGCVNVDEDDFALAVAVRNAINGYGLAATVERTRKKGWHVWSFWRSWVPAWKVRAVLERATRDAANGHAVDVFPKSDSTSGDAPGSFVFLPLFGADITAGRTCFCEPGDDGAPRVIEEWRPSQVTLNTEDQLDEVVDHLGLEIGRKRAPDQPVEIKHPVMVGLVDQTSKRIGWDRDAIMAGLRDLLDGKDVYGAVTSLEEEITHARTQVNGDPAKRDALVEEVMAEFHSVKWSPEAMAARAAMVGISKEADPADPNEVSQTFCNQQLSLFHFERGDLKYVVAEIDNRRGRLVGTIVIQRDKKMLYRGSINLDSEDARKKVEKKVFADYKVGGIAHDLMNVADSIARRIDDEARQERERAENARNYTLTEDEKKAAIAWASKHPRILYDVIDFTSRHGLVREKRNRDLLYLLFTSRKMQKPISGIGKGDSASGKSHLASFVLKLFPEEDIVEFTRISGAALDYRGEYALQHKILFIREAPGSEQAEHSLRTFISEGDLLISTVQKDESGRNVPKDMKVRGPLCFYTTTTAVEVNPENETRLLQIHADESEAMTRSIFDPVAWAAQNGSLDPTDDDLRLWRNFQRVLEKGLDVSIPFALKLREGFPTGTLRARRDFGRLIELIKACAYLHQFHRARIDVVGNDGRPHSCIVASVADYAIVKSLVEGSIMRSSMSVKAGQEEMLQKIAGITESAIEARARGETLSPHLHADNEAGNMAVWIGTPLLRQALGKSQRAIVDLVRSLEDEGLVAVQPNRRPLRVRIGDGVTSGGNFILPTAQPEALFEQYPGDRAHMYDPLEAPDFDDVYLKRRGKA